MYCIACELEYLEDVDILKSYMCFLLYLLSKICCHVHGLDNHI